jgi:hypothetical protein
MRRGSPLPWHQRFAHPNRPVAASLTKVAADGGLESRIRVDCPRRPPLLNSMFGERGAAVARRWWAISAAVAALTIGVFILIFASSPPKKEPRLTETQVLPMAERALKAKMPSEYVD